MTPRLTIALATVVSRAALFAKLHAHLKAQAEGKPVEILVACDNKEISIGRKRQNLLEQATGDYVSYIDDDDWVPEYYVDRILAAVESNPDCVGFKIRCILNGGAPLMASASMRYKNWGDNQDGYRFVRSVYHKTPVRRAIALRVGFPDLRYGEDKVYSAGVMRHVKTESYIDEVMYEYRYRAEPFAQKYGIRAGRVGSTRRSGGPTFDRYGRRVG